MPSMRQTSHVDSYSKCTNIQTDNAVPAEVLKVLTPIRIYLDDLISTQVTSIEGRYSTLTALQCKTHAQAVKAGKQINKHQPRRFNITQACYLLLKKSINKLDQLSSQLQLILDQLSSAVAQLVWSSCVSLLYCPKLILLLYRAYYYATTNKKKDFGPQTYLFFESPLFELVSSSGVGNS